MNNPEDKIKEDEAYTSNHGILPTNLVGEDTHRHSRNAIHAAVDGEQ
jgi:hypothetical protein